MLKSLYFYESIQNLKRYFNNGLVFEGVVVTITEYIMLGSFVMVSYFINHYYSTSYVGVYFLAYSISQIVILGFGSAFTSLMRRDLSTNKYSLNDYFAKVQYLRFGNLLIGLVLSAITILFFYQTLTQNLFFILLMIGTKGFDALNESYYTAYQTLNKLTEYSALKIFNASAFLLISGYSCLNHYDIAYLYYGQLLISIIFFAINLYRWKRLMWVDSIELKKVKYRFLLIESLPLIINTLIFQLGLRLNTVLIFDEIGDKGLGVFSIIVMVISVLTGIANAFGIVFFGRLSRAFLNDTEVFIRVLRQTIILSVIFGMVSCFIFLAFRPFVDYLFNLAEYYKLYFVMAGAIPFIFFTGFIGGIFVVINQQKIGMYLSTLVLIFNIAIYYFLTRYFGLIGSGFAYLAASVFQSIVIFIGVFICLKHQLKVFNFF